MGAASPLHCIPWQDVQGDFTWSASHAMNQCLFFFFPQFRLEHGEWDSPRSPIIGSCGSQEQALLIDLTSSSCRRVRREKAEERALCYQTGCLCWGQGVKEKEHGPETGRVWKAEGNYWDVPRCWPQGAFLSGCLFSAVVGEGNRADLSRVKLSDFHIFFSDPEWCWMEAGPAFALSLPDEGAPAGSCLLSDGSCPTRSMSHRPSLNLVLTFWTTPPRTWNSLTSNIKTINSSGTVFPLTGPLLQFSTESACKNRGGCEHRLELQGPVILLSPTAQGLTLLQWLLSPMFVQVLQGSDILWSCERCWGMSFSQEDGSNKPNNRKSSIILIDTFFPSCILYFLPFQRGRGPAINMTGGMFQGILPHRSI